MIIMKQCKVCKGTKDETEFYKHPNSKDKLRQMCKECLNSESLEKYKIMKSTVAGMEALKIRWKKQRIKWREKRMAHKKDWHSALKLKIINHYTKGSMKCKRCGFDDVRALQVDHVNGGGYAHRKSLGNSSTSVYTYLKRNNYPVGFQILCANCNWIKRVENGEYSKTKKILCHNSN